MKNPFCETRIITWLHTCCILYLIFISNFSKVSGAATDIEFDDGDFLLDVEDYSNDTSSSRDGRVFPFLAVVRLPPRTCQAVMGNTMQVGVCRTKKQCNRAGGTESGGSCGGGYGVCCMITQTCQAGNNGQPVVVDTTGTHITQPVNAMAPSSCRFNFPRPNGVCQVRLDFVNFRLAGPDQNGDCTTDSFTVAGADNLRSFITCGVNTGQHMYLHYGDADTISATINIGMNGAMYDILVNYIRCREGNNDNDDDNNKKRKGRRFDNNDNGGGKRKNNNNNNNNNGTTILPAPPGCTQYFTTTSGMVQSFNYVMDPNNNMNNNPVQRQINNEMYTVCVQTFSGTDQITWTACDPANVNSFCITQDPLIAAGVMTGSACITDYVDIPGSPDGRYCGCGPFPQMVVSNVKPYMLIVNFNQEETFGLNLPMDPATGCQLGGMCLWNGLPIDPLNPPAGAPPIPPCDMTNPALVQPDVLQCAANPLFAANTDNTNPGFCLRYTVM